MGLLNKGQWTNQWYDTSGNGGAFIREPAKLRNWISPDSKFTPVTDRYHLYVSYACPWAHRTLIFRQLKKLEAHITVSVVSPDMLDNGWTFDRQNHSSGDDLYNADSLYQVYTRHDPQFTGRVTVPVLWDKQEHCIVNNESADIIRIFNTAFNDLTGNDLNFYPESLQTKINQLNELIYDNINNGVYRCGFATSQDAYTKAYIQLFDALDLVEQILEQNLYLTGDTITEADWRLFTTLIRFDAVYHGHFKCNRQKLEEFPNLSNYVRALYQWPGVAETVHFYHIKRHYYFSHTTINPTQIVPAGPELDFSTPHNRTRSHVSH